MASLSAGTYTRLVHRGGGRYKPMLEHIARRKGRRQTVIRVRQQHAGGAPVLTPRQIDGICEACAVWDPAVQEWRGSVRDRLLWALLAETGLRLGEALGLRHRDWHTGRGDTPFIEVVPREHPHRVRVKGGGYRKLYISDELDRLYGEYLWQLCDAGADVAVADLDDWYVFVNLAREPRFAPGSPTASMTWWIVSAASSPGAFPAPGHPPRRCCWPGSRSTWSPEDSVTPTCRPR